MSAYKRFHLSTVVFLTICIGFLMYLNLVPRVVGDPKAPTHYSYSVVIGEHTAFYGFPYVAYESGIGTQGVPPRAWPFSEWKPDKVLANSLFAAAALTGVFFLSEFAIRIREKRALRHKAGEKDGSTGSP